LLRIARPRFGKRSMEVAKRRAGFPLFNVEVDPRYKKSWFMSDEDEDYEMEDEENFSEIKRSNPLGHLSRPRFGKRSMRLRKGLEDMIRPRFGKRSGALNDDEVMDKRALQMMIRPRFGKRSSGVYEDDGMDKRALQMMIRPRFGKRSAYEDEGMDKRALQMMMRPRFGKRGVMRFGKRSIEDMIRPRFGKRSIEDMIRPRFGKRSEKEKRFYGSKFHQHLWPQFYSYSEDDYNSMILTPYGAFGRVMMEPLSSVGVEEGSVGVVEGPKDRSPLEKAEKE